MKSKSLAVASLLMTLVIVTVAYMVKPSQARRSSPSSYPQTSGWYYIQTKVSNLNLDVLGGSCDIGGHVCTAKQHPDQVWKLIPAEREGYFYVQSGVSGLYLDVLGGGKNDGTHVVQAYKHPDQVWKLIPAGPPPGNPCNNAAGGDGGRGSKSATLVVNLDCMDTTEAGEDEVYIILIGKTSDGRVVQARLPADMPHEEAGHWNMNDGDDDNNKHINGIRLATADLASGQSIAWDVLLMEEDGGTSARWQELASAILKETGDPYALAAAGILDFMKKVGFKIVDDKDEFLGAWSVVVTNKGGTLNTEWRAMNRIFQEDPERKDQFLPRNSHRFYLNGGNNDQRYHMTCYVQ
jgi:hypothetical protein